VVLAHDRELGGRILVANQEFKLPVDEFEPAGNLLAPCKPAFLPVIKLLFNGRINAARFFEVPA
jgi:hypothetical protein